MNSGGQTSIILNKFLLGEMGKWNAVIIKNVHK